MTGIDQNYIHGAKGDKNTPLIPNIELNGGYDKDVVNHIPINNQNYGEDEKSWTIDVNTGSYPGNPGHTATSSIDTNESNVVYLPQNDTEANNSSASQSGGQINSVSGVSSVSISAISHETKIISGNEISAEHTGITSGVSSVNTSVLTNATLSGVVGSIGSEASSSSMNGTGDSEPSGSVDVASVLVESEANLTNFQVIENMIDTFVCSDVEVRPLAVGHRDLNCSVTPICDSDDNIQVSQP